MTVMRDNSATTDDTDHVTTLVALDGVDPESLSPRQVTILRDAIFDVVDDLESVDHEYLDVVVKDEDGVRL